MKSFTCMLIIWIWIFVDVLMHIQVAYFVPRFNIKTEVCNWCFPSVTFSLFSLKIYYLQRLYHMYVDKCVVYYTLFLLYHTGMWPCHWSNNVWSQLGPYMEFHISMQHDYLAWPYLRPCCRGEIFYYFPGIMFIHLYLLFLAY